MDQPHPHQHPHESNEFVRVLAQFDEGLLAGAPSDVETSTIDERLRATLGEALDFLRVMETVWPRHAAAAGQTGNSSDVLTDASSGMLPRFIGRFGVSRVLGRGGVGIVYLARDSRLSRDVAIKVPRIEMVVTPKMRERFLREAQTAALLSHPNIIPTLEVGDEGDMCFIVYKYCPGPTLAKWLGDRGAPAPWPETVALMRRLAEAMAHAHERGVLHRDLKPSNVLLDRDDLLAPRITDFGLAKLIDAEQLTHTGDALGTPAYMSPEQTRGEKEHGPACDIWALGVILYEMLTGRRPFHGPVSLDVARAIQEDEPIPPRRLNAGIPLDLEKICLMCLAKDPQRRYRSAQDLADDLDRFQRGLPVRARKASWLEHAWKWARRRPASASLVALLVLVAIAATAGVWIYTGRLEDLVASGQREKDARKREEEAEQKSKALAVQVEAEEARSRRLRYVADVRGAKFAARDHDPALARGLLNQWPGNFAIDERGLEWFQLNRQLGPRQQKNLLAPLVQPGHKAQAQVEKAIRAFAMSPSGETTANSRDTVVDVYDVKTAKRIAVLVSDPTEERVHEALAFDPANRLLAAAYNRRFPDGSTHPEVTLWNWRSKKPIETLAFPDLAASTMDVVFHPDGKTLIVRAGGTLSVHSAERFPETLNKLDRDDVRKTTLSRDGSLLALANKSSKRIEVRDFPSLEVKRTVPWPEAGDCEHLCFSGDGRVLAYGTTLAVFVLELDRSTPQPVGDDWVRGRIASICLSNKGDWMHISTEPDNIAVFSTKSLRIVSHELTHVFSHQMLLDDDRLVLRTKQGGVELRCADWPDPTDSIDFKQGRLYALAFSPRGHYLAVAGQGLVIRIFNPHTLRKVRGLSCLSEVHSMAFSPDGATLVAGDIQGQIHRWDLATWQPLPPFEGHLSRVAGLRFTPDGAFLISMGWDKTCRLWRVATGEVEHVFEGPFDNFSGIALAPDASEFAWIGDDPTIRIWNLEKKEERTLPSVKKGRAIAYTPDGLHLVTSGADGTLRLLDRAGAVKRQVHSHADGVRSIAFSPNGKVLASAGLDRVVKLHDADSLSELMTLQGPLDELRSLAWSTKGDMLAATGHDGRIWIWRTR